MTEARVRVDEVMGEIERDVRARLRRHLLVERQQVERLLAGSEQVRCLA